MSIQTLVRFVHVGFSFRSGILPPATELEKVFGSAGDWLRYDLHCWILHTAVPLDELRERIRKSPVLSEADSFFLCEFEPTKYSGYQNSMVWEWIQQKQLLRYNYLR